MAHQQQNLQLFTWYEQHWCQQNQPAYILALATQQLWLLQNPPVHQYGNLQLATLYEHSWYGQNSSANQYRNLQLETLYDHPWYRQNRLVYQYRNLQLATFYEHSWYGQNCRANQYRNLQLETLYDHPWYRQNRLAHQYENLHLEILDAHHEFRQNHHIQQHRVQPAAVPEHDQILENLLAIVNPKIKREWNNFNNNINDLINLRPDERLSIFRRFNAVLTNQDNEFPRVQLNEPLQLIPLMHHQQTVRISGENRRQKISVWVNESKPIRKNAQRCVSLSEKVFIGGIPKTFTETKLIELFGKYGVVKIDWPKGAINQKNSTRICAYLIFETEERVKFFLQFCNYSYIAANYYYHLPSTVSHEEIYIQVIPWVIGELIYSKVLANQILNSNKCIFVGGIHGSMTAKSLVEVLNDIFGGVVYAELSSDKHLYPSGSAKVFFDNHRSHMNAIKTESIEIKTRSYVRKIQLFPYLEDSQCSVCKLYQGPFFCWEVSCFNYYCSICWWLQHGKELLFTHKPIVRTASKAKKH